MAAVDDTAASAPRSPVKRHSIPSLDGLRGISVIVIVCVHAIGTRGAPLGWGAVTGGQNFARAFLYIFLCQSGYLITRILLRERNRTGRISLGRFYLRRAFRIFPAYGVYLLTIGILGVVGAQSVPGSSLAHSATYTVNYVQESSHLVGHFWTLSIEEQFYLLWPLILLLAGPRRARKVLVFAILAAPVMHGLAYIPPATRNQSAYFFTSAMDVMGWGCLLAIVEKDAWFDRARRKIGSLPALIATVALGFAVYQLPGAASTAQHAGLGTLVFTPTLSLIALVLVVRYSSYPAGPFGRVLNWRPIAWLGEISYSVYLWHVLFANRFMTGTLASFPLNVFFSFAVGALSYYLVELPTRVLRDRLVPDLGARPPDTMASSTSSREQTSPA